MIVRLPKMRLEHLLELPVGTVLEDCERTPFRVSRWDKNSVGKTVTLIPVKPIPSIPNMSLCYAWPERFFSRFPQAITFVKFEVMRAQQSSLADWLVARDRILKGAPFLPKVEIVSAAPGVITFHTGSPDITLPSLNHTASGAVVPVPCPTLENTVNQALPILKLTTKTLVNNTDAATLTVAQIHGLILEQEAYIQELGTIKAKPKKLAKEIADRQAGIDALVAYLDSLEAIK